MSRHSFDPEIAKQVGLNAAVIYQNICWWIEKNAANGRNIHDGRVWTYNSIPAFEELFPYLTEKQIRTALMKLEDAPLLVVGNYNKDGRDRTKWYALVHEPKGRMHLPKRADTSAQKGGPLPDSKPDSKQYTPIPPEGADLFSENKTPESTKKNDSEIEEGFNTFWNEWPKHKRKTGKADCAKVYRAACEGRHPKADGKLEPDQINRAAQSYVASLKGDLTYLKGPLPWLRLPGWEPFLQEPEFREEDLSEFQLRALQEGRVPPSMLDDGKPNATARFWLKAYGFTA